jgi:subtilisin-like proprotein convertase family protein
MAAAGTWTLRVTDRAAGEQGFLLGWSIGINQEAPSLDLPGSRPPPL